MIKPIRRSAIFEKYGFVDSQIAFEQQATFRSINKNDPEEMEYMLPLLDHLEPFDPQLKPLDGFCILAYNATSKEDYVANFPRATVDFFSKMKIESIFLLTELVLDWKDYAFENPEKRTSFLNLVSHQTHEMGYLMDVKDLPDILPLFFFAHPDYPHILLVPAEGEVPISLLLCKDGNFHALFDEAIGDSLKLTTEQTGLKMGSFEICHAIRNNSFAP